MSDKLVGQIKTPQKIQGEIITPSKIQGQLNYSSYEVCYDKNYLHIQSEVSDEWLINHNLNKYPSVSVIDSAENEVVGEIEYIDLNNLKIKFMGGFSGKATLN